MKRITSRYILAVFLSILLVGCVVNNKNEVITKKVDENCYVDGEVINKTESQKQKYDCESNGKCEWKNLGGELESVYACCPIGLQQSPESLEKYATCFVAID